MKSIPKLIKRFVAILLISLFLFLLTNFFILFIISKNMTASGSPYTTANETAKKLQRTENGYCLDKDTLTKLNEWGAWAFLIDDTTHKIVWCTDNLPNHIPEKYSLSDISDLTLGYIQDYPTYTGASEYGLFVIGYPKDRYWKSMYPTWDYYFIKNFPKTLIFVFSVNLALIFFIYIITSSKLIKSVKPIIAGIQALGEDKSIHIKETGIFSELAMNINHTSDILESQKYQLRKKETARANWIAGVSHDIRTPLSMVMGYASQLKHDIRLTDDEREKAAVIVKQSSRIGNLINDLNLASKLEYNMQPTSLYQENIIAIVRQVVVDFINITISDKYKIEWKTDNDLSVCLVNADKNLMKRAVSNLIQNSINHNENGCTIYVHIQTTEKECLITVSDDGVGATDEEIDKINNTPHYMVCDHNTFKQAHGLGLLIVKQIASVHNGSITIKHSRYGGFEASIILPLS